MSAELVAPDPRRVAEAYAAEAEQYAAARMGHPPMMEVGPVVKHGTRGLLWVFLVRVEYGDLCDEGLDAVRTLGVLQQAGRDDLVRPGYDWNNILYYDREAADAGRMTTMLYFGTRADPSPALHVNKLFVAVKLAKNFLFMGVACPARYAPLSESDDWEAVRFHHLEEVFRHCAATAEKPEHRQQAEQALAILAETGGFQKG